MSVDMDKPRHEFATIRHSAKGHPGRGYDRNSHANDTLLLEIVHRHRYVKPRQVRSNQWLDVRTIVAGKPAANPRHINRRFPLVRLGRDLYQQLNFATLRPALLLSLCEPLGVSRSFNGRLS